MMDGYYENNCREFPIRISFIEHGRDLVELERGGIPIEHERDLVEL